jgi:hypothetical protein
MNTATITYRTGSYYGDATSNHVFEITDAAGIAAELYVSVERLEVMNIETREDRRCEGLARTLWEAANDRLGEVFHAPVAHRTFEGNAFAEAVGGESVDCDHGCCA